MIRDAYTGKKIKLKDCFVSEGEYKKAMKRKIV